MNDYANMEDLTSSTSTWKPEKCEYCGICKNHFEQKDHMSLRNWIEFIFVMAGIVLSAHIINFLNHPIT